MFYKTYYMFLIYGSISLVAVGDIGSDIRRSFAKQILSFFGNGTLVIVKNVENVSACFSTQDNGMDTINETCLLGKFLSPDDAYKLSGISGDMSVMNISTLSMILLHTLESKTRDTPSAPKALRYSQVEHQEEDFNHIPVTLIETWGYGILCTTVIVLAALGGLLALPFVHGANYKRLLIYMVGLAVGTLSGNSILFLIPKALELHEEDFGVHNPLWKSLMSIAAIYTFFIVERVLKIITSWRESHRNHRHHKELHNEIKGGRFAKLKPETRFRDSRFTDLKTISQNSLTGENVPKDTQLHNAPGHEAANDFSTQANGASSNSDIERDEDVKRVSPVALMIFFGGVIHIFVDGVSIGAAFTDSVLGGLSISVAVFCEELPHELGDFAVHLHAGMSKKRAALLNFLSACTIYIGLIVGVFLGENMAANTWIFAFAGGMFMYIALVDMIPEMCAAGESEENKKLVGPVYIFLLQNLGMLSGFGIMFLLAIYDEKLQLAITGEE